MSVDRPYQDLHDKATRGVAVSAPEQVALTQWYEREDTAEHALLERSAATHPASRLQPQIDTALAELLNVTQRIQTLHAESEKVRQEIAVLQRELASRRIVQPA